MSGKHHYFLRPVEQLVLQGTSFCNLDCRYCDLSQASRRTSAKMPVGLVETLLGSLIQERLLATNVVVVWHSGEPLTLSASYYAEAMDAILDLCRRKAPDVVVSFDFQTNGTLIDSTWCDLFERYASVINLGVSCDGPRELHDAFRVDWKGRDSFNRTLRGMEMLEGRGIRYNAIAVVTKATLADPDSFFDFFYQRRKGLTDFHFNVLASPLGTEGGLSYGKDDRDAYYDFYHRIMDLWAERQAAGDGLPIRNFSLALDRITSHGTAGAPVYIEESTAPLRSLNMDTQGNLTTFYAGLDSSTQRHRYGDGTGLSLGNITDQALSTMLISPKLSAMRQDFDHCHRACKHSCEYHAVCPGGFELAQLQANDGTAEFAPETVECLVHVKALTDALLDKIVQQEPSFTSAPIATHLPPEGSILPTAGRSASVA
jgi:uncharacterized protein